MREEQCGYHSLGSRVVCALELEQEAVGEYEDECPSHSVTRGLSE